MKRHSSGYEQQLEPVTCTRACYVAERHVRAAEATVGVGRPRRQDWSLLARETLLATTTTCLALSLCMQLLSGYTGLSRCQGDNRRNEEADECYEARHSVTAAVEIDHVSISF